MSHTPPTRTTRCPPPADGEPPSFSQPSVGHAFAPPTLPRTRTLALSAKTKTKKKKKTAKSPGGFGAAPKKTTLTDEEKEARAIRGAVRDATSALVEARDQEGEAQAWLKLGAVLVRGGEFSEAERVFAAGAEKFDDEEMLRAAELTYRGHSLSYHRGPVPNGPMTWSSTSGSSAGRSRSRTTVV